MNPKRKFAAVGLSAGLLAGGAAGLILQSTGSASAGAKVTVTDPTTPVDDSTPADTNRADRTERITEVLKPLVDDGTLTQEQADKVIQTLVEHLPAGRGGPMGHEGRRHGFENMEAAATAIGISVDDLRTELMSGKTMAQVAEANGKTAQTVIDALVAEAKTRVDAKVADGTLTQAEADTHLSEATERITTAVNSTRPMGDREGRGRHGDGQTGDGQTGDGQTGDGQMGFGRRG